MHRTRLYRFGLVFTAVFQLLFPTFASVADARAEAASERGVHAHVEEQGSNRCPPVHAADCAICRVISGAAVPSEAPVVLPTTLLLVGTSLPPREHAEPRVPAHCTPSQRAPPNA
ncbi:MAG TPA: hypothetical protein VF034_14290 [Gemmatimonadaceae bacterium]|jgi:hypothetical protein